MRYAKALLILMFSFLLAAGASAQTQPVAFHWAPSPATDAQGNPLSQAVGYEVWLSRDAATAEKIATVMGDTVYTLQAEAGVVQRIRVCGFDDQGRTSAMSAWSDPVYFEDVVRSGDGVPGAGALQGNYPNPFNPETRIRYGIPEGLPTGTPVRLEIYAIDGRRVRSFDVDRSAGWHDAVWDGTNDRGVTQATGMYVTRLVVGSTVQTGKMTMLK